MRAVLVVPKVLLPVGAVVLAFSLQAVTDDVAEAWRCRPDAFATAYERDDACPVESWR